MQTWEVLLTRAIRQIEAAKLPDSCWQFGGGTVLMLEYNHRASKDIDIFLNDRQYLSFLSPRLNDALDAEVGNYTEQSNFIRLYFPDGEIDFISAKSITGLPPKKQLLCGKNVQTEHPVEIIAKKIHYRSDEFKARDIFDLATTFQNDRRTMLANMSYFQPHAKILEERIDLMKKRGELKDALEVIDTLPGATQVSGQEYQLCKLFLWNLRQHSQEVSPDTGLKPKPKIRR